MRDRPIVVLHVDAPHALPPHKALVGTACGRPACAGRPS